MTIKDEMKRKEENKENDFTTDYEDKKQKEEPKPDKSEVEIKKLKSCIRETDKHISKIESYFKVRNKCIASILLVLPFTLALLFGFFTSFEDFQATFQYIGMITSIVGSFAIVLLGLDFIWGEEDE